MDLIPTEYVVAVGTALSGAVATLFGLTRKKQKALDETHKKNYRQLQARNSTLEDRCVDCVQLTQLRSEIDHLRIMLDEARQYQAEQAKERLREQKDNTERMITAIHAATQSNDKVVEAVRAFHSDLRDDQLRRTR